MEIKLMKMLYQKLDSGEVILAVVNLNKKRYFLLRERERDYLILFPCNRIAAGAIEDVITNPGDYILRYDDNGRPEFIEYYPDQLGWSEVNE